MTADGMEGKGGGKEGGGRGVSVRNRDSVQEMIKDE